MVPERLRRKRRADRMAINQTVELLAPAGDRECLESAVRYGADAVYLGGDLFGMRASAAFTPETLTEAVAYAHAAGVQVYLTCNTLPTNEEAVRLPEFLREAQKSGVDALIVADVGILMTARREVPNLPIHISTQAGVVNFLTATELFHLGASRVVLARELSLEDVKYLRDHTPPALELEAFIHGAMCMSFSGRCLLSSYLNGRDANRGECTQPCRWGYHLMEEKRPGQYFPIFEDAHGSYILNAQDLCMIEHIDKLVQAGVTSLKIEGRAKSAYYTAAVTGAYRAALDAYYDAPDAFVPPAWTLDEVRKISHREYSTGFFFGRPQQYDKDGGYIRRWEVVAVVTGWRDGCLVVQERNRFSTGERLEAMMPGGAPIELNVERIIDPEQGEIDCARHPMREYLLPYAGDALPKGAMLRRENTEQEA